MPFCSIHLNGFDLKNLKTGFFISSVNNTKGKTYHTVQNKKLLGDLTKIIQLNFVYIAKKES